MKITKSFHFDASHQLVNHSGKCANLHGHTYKLEVCISGSIKQEQASDEGMVYDFGDLKKIVKTQILDHFDHAVILHGNEPIAELVTTKRILFGRRTTAENMALYMAYVIRKNLPENIILTFVRLWETTSSYAETELEDFEEINTAQLESIKFYDSNEQA